MYLLFQHSPVYQYTLKCLFRAHFKRGLFIDLTDMFHTCISQGFWWKYIPTSGPYTLPVSWAYRDSFGTDNSFFIYMNNVAVITALKSTTVLPLSCMEIVTYWTVKNLGATDWLIGTHWFDLSVHPSFSPPVSVSATLTLLIILTLEVQF